MAHTKTPMVTVITGRGCPYRCSFCQLPQVMYGHKYRTRSPENVVDEFEYIETHLVVVPHNSKKDFLKSYETLSPMVVPRSAYEITKDDEFVLFAVTTFKKHSAEFQHKCREMKWTPRDYKYIEGGKEEERKEIEKVSKDERKVWGEALRLGRTGWSEAVMI